MLVSSPFLLSLSLFFYFCFDVARRTHRTRIRDLLISVAEQEKFLRAALILAELNLDLRTSRALRISMKEQERRSWYLLIPVLCLLHYEGEDNREWKQLLN